MDHRRSPGSDVPVRQEPRDGLSAVSGPDPTLVELAAAVDEYEPFADFRLLRAARALVADVR